MSHKDKARHKARHNAYSNAWTKKKRDEDPVFRALSIKRSTAYQKQHPEKTRATAKRYRVKNVAAVMVRQAQQRARRQGIACDLKVGDVVIPTHCPVFGTALVSGPKHNATSPSLDRIKPHLGYVKGNVRVISWRANCLKRDGTIEEFEKILDYMRHGVRFE